MPAAPWTRIAAVGALMSTIVALLTTPGGAAAPTTGTISGIVVDTDGNVVRNGKVEVVELDGTPVASVSTQIDGTFRAIGLPSAAYRVRFSASGHTPEWWQDSATPDDASPVSVRPGDSPFLHAVLAHGPFVIGRLVDPSGTPVGFASVVLDGQSYGVPTEHDGTFELGALSPGGYRLLAHHRDFTQAIRDFTVGVPETPGSKFDLGDIVIHPGSVISGTVETADGSMPQGVVMHLMTLDGEGVSFTRSPEVDPRTGAFRLRHLPANSYVLGAWQPDGGDLARTYLGSPYRAGATVITVGLDDQVEGVVVQMPRGRVLRGTVTGTPSSTPWALRLDLVAPVEPFAENFEIVPTSASGSFSLGGLRPGRYRAAVSCLGGHAPRHATYIDVGTAPVTRSDIDLPAGACDVRASGRARISGKARVSRQLRVSAPALAPRRSAVRYAWYVGNRRVATTTRSTMQVRPAWRGKRVRAQVVASMPGYRTLRTWTPRTSRVR